MWDRIWKWESWGLAFAHLTWAADTNRRRIRPEGITFGTDPFDGSLPTFWPMAYDPFCAKGIQSRHVRRNSNYGRLPVNETYDGSAAAWLKRVVGTLRHFEQG